MFEKLRPASKEAQRDAMVERAQFYIDNHLFPMIDIVFNPSINDEDYSERTQEAMAKLRADPDGFVVHEMDTLRKAVEKHGIDPDRLDFTHPDRRPAPEFEHSQLRPSDFK